MDERQRRCPDAGVCHHECVVGCWRVTNAGPLSGHYPRNEWPDSVDILANLDGAVPLWWCEEHDSEVPNDVTTTCRVVVFAGWSAKPCRLVLWHRFRIPLPDKETP